VKAVGGVQPVRPVRIFALAGEHIVVDDLAHRHPVAIAVKQRAEAGEERQRLGLRLVVELPLEADRRRGRARVRRGRVVGEARIVRDIIDHVETEAVDAAVEPKTGDVQDRVLHFGIVEVQVRLRTEEVVQIILAALGRPGPGRAAEARLPIVGRGAVRLRVRPDIPVVTTIAPGEAVAEPGVLVRSVGPDLVDDELQPELVRAGEQPVEVVERAEQRVDVPVIGDVIAKILHR